MKLATDELTDYTAKGFALCYIDTCERLDLRDEHDECTAKGFRLLFTEIDLKRQCGDDWNDAPYDCNTGWPYDGTYMEQEGKAEWIEHTVLVLNVTLPYEHYPTLPEEYGYNSPFSVDMINQGACAWMFFGDKCKPVYAGATPLDVLERIGKWMVPCPEVNWEEDKY